MKSPVKGFKNVAKSISRRDGVNVARAESMLASQTRKASTAAVRRNPRLTRVPGVKAPY